MEIESTHQRTNIAIGGVNRHHRALGLRPLHQRPRFALLVHAHDRTTANAQTAVAVIAQPRLRWTQTRSGNLQCFTRTQHGSYRFGRCFGDDSKAQILIVHVIRKRLGDGGIVGRSIIGQWFVSFGAAPRLA